MEKFQTEAEKHFEANNQKNALQLCVSLHNILDLLKFNLISVKEVKSETDKFVHDYQKIIQGIKNEFEKSQKEQVDDRQLEIPTE